MVQLKLQTTFDKLKFDIAAPSLSDCLEKSNFFQSGLALKGTVQSVSLCGNLLKLTKVISGVA